MSLNLNISNYEFIVDQIKRFSPSRCKNLEIIKFEFVAKTQFLYREGSKLKIFWF